MPTGNKAEFEAYRKGIWGVLRMFGDGQTPGEIEFDLVFDNPVVHLRVLEDFTAKLEVGLASEDVKNAFGRLQKFLRGQLGEFPEGMPQVPEMLGEPGGEGGAGGGPPMPEGGMPQAGLPGMEAVM